MLAELDRDGGAERLVVAEALLASFAARVGARAHRVLGKAAGRALEGLRLEHPFYEREVPVVLGDHVTLDAGTGAVHTAPGHGADDYEMGRRYNLPIDNPVGNDGRFVAGTPLFEGLSVWDANPKVIETLRQRRAAHPLRADPAQLPALLAPQVAGDLPRDAAVVPEHGEGRACAATRSTRSAAWSGFPAGASSASPA